MKSRRHVCLVGSALCRNWPLVQRLETGHSLTLVPELTRDDLRVVGTADVVALDCRQGGASGSQRMVRRLRSVTDAPIVVLDGGLHPHEVAHLVSAGAQDYFSEPFNLGVIVERLHHLAIASRSRRRHGRG